MILLKQPGSGTNYFSELFIAKTDETLSGGFLSIPAVLIYSDRAH
jgi:hypothetical protein